MDKEFWASVQKKIDEETGKIDEEKKEVEEERSKLEEEKKAMQKVVSPQEIITLNVGGTIFSTTREALCQVKDSLLASMFSGRWEESLTRDEEGKVFFDFDPELFRFVLSYLRTKKLLQKEIPFPLVPQEKLLEMNAMRDFLGLTAVEPLLDDSFGFVSPRVTITDNKKVVT